jgi:hypothetical protein
LYSAKKGCLHAKELFFFYSFISYNHHCLLTNNMDDKPHCERPAKPSLPSSVPVSDIFDLALLPVVYPNMKYPGQDNQTKGKGASTAASTKMPNVVLPPPLTTPSQAAPTVEDQGTTAPSFGASSDQPSYVVYPNDGYDCDGRYRGQLKTHFNSSQVDGREAQARADFRYHQANRRPNPVPGYGDHFSAAYSDQGVYGQGLRTSYEE